MITMPRVKRQQTGQLHSVALTLMVCAVIRDGNMLPMHRTLWSWIDLLTRSRAAGLTMTLRDLASRFPMVANGSGHNEAYD